MVSAEHEQLLLNWVREAGQDVEESRGDLDDAVQRASEVGISNYRIATAYGVTEATVRARLKRIKRERAK